VKCNDEFDAQVAQEVVDLAENLVQLLLIKVCQFHQLINKVGYSQYLGRTFLFWS